MGWMYMARDRDKRWAVMNTAINIHLLQISVNFLTSSEPTGFSRNTLSFVFINYSEY
jgi:hypothetical protein